MEYMYRWVDKETGKIALLKESVFYGSIITTVITGAIGFNLIFSKMSVSLGNGVEAIGLIGCISSIISSLVLTFSGTLLSESCELRKIYKEEQTNAEGLSFVDRLRMTCKYRNDEETPERDNSSEEGSKTGVYSFLRRFNIIKNLNLVERFRNKNPEEQHLLSQFKVVENFSSGKERERFMQKSSGSGYNTIDML